MKCIILITAIIVWTKVVGKITMEAMGVFSDVGQKRQKSEFDEHSMHTFSSGEFVWMSEAVFRMPSIVRYSTISTIIHYITL